jgi:cell division protein FtsQ
MARKTLSTISEDELEESASEPARRARNAGESPLDARMFDLDDEAESPFLRGQKRVSVRRGALPRKAASRVKILLIFLGVGLAIGVLGIALRRYGTESWRFRLDSSDNLSITGTNNVSRAQVRTVMASDIDRNVFFVPLEERKKQLEQIPWVQSATVMRLLPNRLRIDITERTPVAFVEVGSHIALIDANGVIMELSPGQTTKYSFPVVIGISESDPLSTRAARMKIYSQFAKELDSSGGHYSADISDVDLSDPYDIKATVTDPQGAVLVHLGPANFLEHFKVYVAHVQEWRTQFKKLESVDLRYDHQVIVNPDSPGVEVPQGAANTPASAVTATPLPAQQKKTPSKTKKHT